jgi:hypothetical protein
VRYHNDNMMDRINKYSSYTCKDISIIDRPSRIDVRNRLCNARVLGILNAIYAYDESHHIVKTIEIISGRKSLICM